MMTATLLAIVAFAALMHVCLALNDTSYQWSANNSAYARGTGTYAQIGDAYNNQYHEGNITIGGDAGETRFKEYDQSHSLIFDSGPFFLCNNSGEYRSYTHEGIYYIDTRTHSHYTETAASIVEVEIGPPGTQR